MTGVSVSLSNPCTCLQLLPPACLFFPQRPKPLSVSSGCRGADKEINCCMHIAGIFLLALSADHVTPGLVGSKTTQILLLEDDKSKGSHGNCGKDWWC
ncbi:hypothetical protein ATANTOWER_020147 [Ataeniobius toweri]|uniref:Uncharacterized protein n=1 Tax=Ataeniobius toweri TaxID=208326 RepID=A0ABU7A7A5_9TELE|nr:hypothetical protein [Ataeniobius toweri]